MTAENYLWVKASSASTLVVRVLRALCEEQSPCWTQAGPRGQGTRELRGCWYRLEDPTRCATWLPQRRLNYPFMVAEWLWTFLGRNDVEMLSFYNEAVGKFSDDGHTFWGAYGPPWRGQIDGVVHRLRKDPETRQAIVGIWRPRYNERDEFGYIVTKDVPCTLTMQYLLRDGKLEAYVIMRSSDSWLGLPYDLFNFSMLQRAVAVELGVDIGSLTLFVGSSHLYECDLTRAKEVLAAFDSLYDEYLLTESSYHHMALPVPAPWGLEIGGIYQYEEILRKEITTDVMLAFIKGGSVSWEPFLSMLAYRQHRDSSFVHSSLRSLVLT